MLKIKIYSDSDNYLLYGLFYKDIEDSGNYIMAISYDIELLYQFRNTYFDKEEIKNSSVKSIEPLEIIKKIKIFGILNNLCYSKNTFNNYKVKKNKYINKNTNSYNDRFLCFEFYEYNDNINDNCMFQQIIVYNDKYISNKDIQKIKINLKGNLIQHNILLDKFYPDSIRLNNFY